MDEKHPATLTFKDFNRDNQTDPYFCYYIGDKSYPYASRDEALGQVNALKQRFPDYNSYANATLEDIFTEEELSDAVTLEAVNLKSMYFENTGKGFKAKVLPVQAQFSPLYALAALDTAWANGFLNGSLFKSKEYGLINFLDHQNCIDNLQSV